MEKKFYLIATLCLLAGLSCNTIDPSHRLIEVEQLPANKTVLLTEYTDQNCVNCPKATLLVEALDEQYGENLIPVSIHVATKPFPLVTSTGKEYNAVYSSDFTHPAATVDGGTYSIYTEEWGTLVRNAIPTTALVDVALSCKYDEATKQLIVVTHVRGVEKTPAGLKLQLWAIENGIVSWQLMEDGSRNPSYVHNHVFRAALNGIWGEAISVQPGEVASVTTNYTVTSTDWKVSNMEIVGFVYSGSNFGAVLQAAKAKVE